jgi:hypothetical protein
VVGLSRNVSSLQGDVFRRYLTDILKGFLPRIINLFLLISHTGRV